MIWLEIFGYIGTVLVIVSMLMTSVLRLRVINIIGGVISGIYAVLVGATPVALMNLCLVCINLFNVYRLLRTKRQFDVVQSHGKDAMVQYFLRSNSQDIGKFFPEFDPDSAADAVAFVVCCDGNPAGILLGKPMEDGTLDVRLDYSIPAYRDCSVGGYLYKNLPGLGVNKLVAGHPAADTHLDYLEKMGFIRTDDQYIKFLQ